MTGIDCLTSYYPRRFKSRNLSSLADRKGFRFVRADLLSTDLRRLLRGVSVVYHQAAQPGVRASWGADFRVYVRNNIQATQALLEAARGARLKAFVYASSSSVYGDVDELPLKETARPRPYSPYGVSKLSAENLCFAYHRNFGVPVTALRYFTVYGPGQRPDMAFHKWLLAALRRRALEVYGDGRQSRDFTYVDDAVEANLLAMKRGRPGTIYNIGGGSRIEVNKALALIGKVTGSKLKVRRTGRQKGDVRHTLADTRRARRELGFKPKVKLAAGLAAEWEFIRAVYGGARVNRRRV